MDISMPGMSGIEVARELKRRGNNAKIVFSTVHEDSDIIAACFAAGRLGCVVKILVGTDLIPAINEPMAGRSFVSAFLHLARYGLGPEQDLAVAAAKK
jgi:DNA-binding NarL/FixJ family response regulator